MFRSFEHLGSDTPNGGTANLDQLAYKETDNLSANSKSSGFSVEDSREKPEVDISRIEQGPLNHLEEERLTPIEGHEIDVHLIEQNLIGYLEREGLIKNLEILNREKGMTPFKSLRTHEKPAKKACYIYIGLATGGNESSFSTLANRLYEDGYDVYIVDREGEFDGNYALNGIFDNLDKKDPDGNKIKHYNEVNVFAISIASSEIGRAMDERSDEIDAREESFSLTYYDPYDRDYFSLGDRSADSLPSRLSRPILGALCALVRVATSPVGGVVLQARPGGEEEHPLKENISVGFLARQFSNLSSNRIFDESGKLYARKYLARGGVVSTKTDAFLDTEKRNEAIATDGILCVIRSGPHGIVDDELIAKILEEDSELQHHKYLGNVLPSEAIRTLHRSHESSV